MVSFINTDRVAFACIWLAGVRVGISEADREFAQLPVVEIPEEWFGGLYVIVLKRQQTVCDVGERLKIIGHKDFALHDRKVNLEMIEPTCVH